MIPKRFAVALTALAFASVAWVGCSGGDRPPRVLLVGIDGASPRVVDALLKSGRLPNLARIAEAGVHGPLRSSFPLLSPRVWTTIATGKEPEQHGIHSWVRPIGKDRTRLYYSYDRKAHALWNIVSNSGRSVGVINWLVTYPPEIVRGVMVSDHSFVEKGFAMMGKLFSGDRTFEPGPTREAAGATAYPVEWKERVIAAADKKASAVPSPFENREGFRYPILVDGFSKFYELDQQLASVALEVEDELRPDLMMVLFQGIDRVSHHLWAGIEEPSEYKPKHRLSKEEHARAREAVEDYYAFTDDLIGVLVSQLEEDDLVIVVSDHGFEAQGWRKLTGGHDTDAAIDGVLFARGRNIVPDNYDGGMRVVDVTPTILAWLGIPLAKDMDGAPAEFLEVELPEPIPTYDTDEVPRLSAGDSGADDVILDQLRSLGYID